MSAADGELYEIDDGARLMVRATERSFEAALARLPELAALCPADCYPLRVVMQGDPSRGRRFAVRVVFQRRGHRPDTRADVRRAERWGATDARAMAGDPDPER